MTPVLEAHGVSVSFGGVRALVDVDLQVEPGQLLGLIGPNGAGKTTFIDAITGFVGYRGSVVLDGRDLSGKAPHERARLGLARTWQSIELFDDLTVEENVAVAGAPPVGLGDGAERRLGVERRDRAARERPPPVRSRGTEWRDAERAVAGGPEARRRGARVGGGAAPALPRRARGRSGRASRARRSVAIYARSPTGEPRRC